MLFAYNKYISIKEIVPDSCADITGRSTRQQQPQQTIEMKAAKRHDISGLNGVSFGNTMASMSVQESSSLPCP